MLILNQDLKESYLSIFEACKVNENCLTEVNQILQKISANRARYESVSSVLTVPWYVIAVIHSLEASLNFNCHLHNGDPLTRRTVHVPAGRPVSGNPPFTWEESAMDALRLEGLDHWTDWSLPGISYKLERYNGIGYRAHGTNSPYLWGGSNMYISGKYIQDNVFSTNAVSKQIGGLVLIKCMIDKKIIDPISERSSAGVMS
jgi:lysozyme family protein